MKTRTKTKMTSREKLPAFLRSSEAAWRWAQKYVDLDLDADAEDFYRREDFYRERAEDYAYRAREIVRADHATVYRAITVSKQLGLRGVNFDCLGKAWSDEEGSAGTQGTVPSGIHDPIEIVLIGKVAPRWIDWEYGFTSFMYYGKDQWEISLLENAPVLITGLAGRFRRDFTPPIQGNVGSAGEEWVVTCTETFTPRDVRDWQLGTISRDAEGRPRWGSEAAGILFVTRTEPRYVLLVLRSDEVMDPGVWGIPGGRVEPHHRNAFAAALAEAREELGSIPRDFYPRRQRMDVYESGQFRYTTFIVSVNAYALEWKPRLNWENDDWGWFLELPRPLHPNVERVLRRLQCPV